MERTFTASELLAVLDAEWHRSYDLARLDIIKREETGPRNSSLMAVAKTLGVGQEFIDYGIEPQPDAGKAAV